VKCGSVTANKSLCRVHSATVLRKNLASAKIVKIECNANSDLVVFSHFITYKECRKVP